MLKFLGAPYPIVETPKGYLATISGLETLRSDLLILLLTNPGERVMLPNYGTPLRELVHEPNDIILQSRAREMIVDAINNWEPRITVDAIEVTSAPASDFLASNDDLTEQDRILGIKILFKDPQNITEVQELVLQVPLN